MSSKTWSNPMGHLPVPLVPDSGLRDRLAVDERERDALAARLAAVDALAYLWENPATPHDLVDIALRNHAAARLRAALRPDPSEAPA